MWLWGDAKVNEASCPNNSHAYQVRTFGSASKFNSKEKWPLLGAIAAKFVIKPFLKYAIALHDIHLLY